MSGVWRASPRKWIRQAPDVDAQQTETKGALRSQVIFRAIEALVTRFSSRARSGRSPLLSLFTLFEQRDAALQFLLVRPLRIPLRARVVELSKFKRIWLLLVAGGFSLRIWVVEAGWKIIPNQALYEAEPQPGNDRICPADVVLTSRIFI